MGKGREHFERQAAFLTTGDVDGLVENQYTPDAELVRFDTTVKGADALRTYFTGYMTFLKDVEFVSLDNFVETDDTVMFEATLKVKGEPTRVYDAWVLRDGRIHKHFTGVM